MNKELSKSFHLTDIFKDAVPTANWNHQEVKIAMSIFSYLDKYKIYLPDFDTKDEVDELLSQIPLDFTLSKLEFISIVGSDAYHFSRDIKNIRESMSKKIFTLAHPTDDHKDSGITMPWFKKISYSEKNKEITFTINELALESLVTFVKYTKIKYEYLKPLKSSYSIYTYLFLKIIKDISNQKKKNHERVLTKELKYKLGLADKYSTINKFKTKVLDVVKSEINEYTDLDFDYELEKEGRAYKYINLYFDYKKQTVIEAPKNINSDKELFDIGHDSEDYESSESIFEGILFSWGIRAKKIAEIETIYSLNAINEAIKITEQAISGNLIKTTPAAFFLGTLENKQQAEDIEYDKQLQLQKKAEEKALLEEKERTFQALQSKIYLYESEISKLLTAISMEANIQISDELLIELEKMNTVNKEIFNGYKSMFPVLIHGYYDFKQQKNVSPNMYNFLKLITTV
ncbi:replication initiation protein, partial [Francisella philomiragia]|uniref:replication initiation protein n=1 Tax=Francisella philomiragia TaxID=28110 RepID=UPI001902CBE4